MATSVFIASLGGLLAGAALPEAFRRSQCLSGEVALRQDAALSAPPPADCR